MVEIQIHDTSKAYWNALSQYDGFMDNGQVINTVEQEGISWKYDKVSFQDYAAQYDQLKQQGDVNYRSIAWSELNLNNKDDVQSKIFSIIRKTSWILAPFHIIGAITTLAVATFHGIQGDGAWVKYDFYRFASGVKHTAGSFISMFNDKYGRYMIEEATIQCQLRELALQPQGQKTLKTFRDLTPSPAN